MSWVFSPPLWLCYSFEITIRLICFYLYSFLECFLHPLLILFFNMQNINMVPKVTIVQKHPHTYKCPFPVFSFFTSFLPIPSRLSNFMKLYLVYPFWVFSRIAEQTYVISLSFVYKTYVLYSSPGWALVYSATPNVLAYR